MSSRGILVAVSAVAATAALSIAVGTAIYGVVCGVRVPTYLAGYISSAFLGVTGLAGILVGMLYIPELPRKEAEPLALACAFIAFVTFLGAVALMDNACPLARSMADALSPFLVASFPLACVVYGAYKSGTRATRAQALAAVVAAVTFLGASIAYAVHAYNHFPGSNIYLYYSTDDELRAGLPLANKLADAARQCGYHVGVAEVRIPPGEAGHLGLDTLPAVVMPRGLYDHMTTGFPCIDPLYYSARHWRDGLVIVHGPTSPPDPPQG